MLRVFYVAAAIILLVYLGAIAMTLSTPAAPHADDRIGHCYTVTGYSGKAGYLYAEITCPTSQAEPAP
jgi:hypothetical protein